ncbi:Solute carrier family 23 member 1 [Gossypium arboreum]|uniref:Solute carrier family 23 member 1 n=1 Tax=Gossypium arboreum TaxID=29729 RepID=A0A0B0PHV3_GOSAR|nr:Solute carrier family 23 member 1 [Gossypium arboreum]
MSELNMCYPRKYRQSFNLGYICHDIGFRHLLLCKTTSGTLTSTFVLHVRPCLGHRHHI